MEDLKRLGQVVWIAAVLFLLLGLGPKSSGTHVTAASKDAVNGAAENSGEAIGQANNETRYEAEGDQPTCLPSEGFTCAELWAKFLRIPSYYYGFTLGLWKNKDSFVQVVTSEWEVYLWRGQSVDR